MRVNIVPVSWAAQGTASWKMIQAEGGAASRALELKTNLRDKFPEKAPTRASSLLKVQSQ